MRQYYVYVMASRSRTLYVGVTNDLTSRVIEHGSAAHASFTHKYRVNRLVYAEVFGDIREAIAAEKTIKGWRRNKKLALIQAANPTWLDLSEGWIPAQKSASDAAAEGNADPSLRSGRQRSAPGHPEGA